MKRRFSKMASSYKARIQEFEQIVNGAAKIDLDGLYKLAFQGIPEESKLRSKIWRLLLNYLPPDKTDWDKILAKKRASYNKFIDEFLKNSDQAHQVEDHPLNCAPESNWQTFFRDNDVLLQIDKDVRRLCPDMSFFQSPTEYPNKYIVNREMERLHTRVSQVVLASSVVEKRGLGLTKMKSMTGGCELEPLQQESEEAHWEVVERILFIYAKLNPGQGYVQGMNEIIGPIYFTMASDPDLVWREHAEADTFHVFTNLMSEIRDFFIRSLDNSSTGIKSMMKELFSRLQKHDYGVWQRLTTQEIHPQYFSFRWITLLLSQEFTLPEVLQIWDSLLSDTKRFDFLIDVCCAMIIYIRNDILAQDFSHNMKLLQNFPSSVDVRDLVNLAIKLHQT